MSNFGKDYFDPNSKKSGWSRVRGTYWQYDYERMYPEFKEMAYDIKTLFSPKRVLDIGCAKGFLVKAFRELGIESYGVDVSEYAISKSPESVKPLLFISDLNSDHLPFEDNSFDTITFLGVLEHLDDHSHALREINRISNIGCTLIMRTLFRKLPGDNSFINVHGRSFWINKFRSFGFTHDQVRTDQFVSSRIRCLLKSQEVIIRTASLLYYNFPQGHRLIHFYLNNVHDTGYLVFLKDI
jgi:SAM-dependent methyltransferase